MGNILINYQLSSETRKPILGTKRKTETLVQPEITVKQPSFSTQYYFQEYLILLDKAVIKDFLGFDLCYMMADNYLLAMVFVYFMRIKLPVSEYNELNFFSCLYLAHDMEEDVSALKRAIIPWVAGENNEIRRKKLLKTKESIWLQMGFRTFISKQKCDEVMEKFPNHSIWDRKRDMIHAGALRPYLAKYEKCSNCKSDRIGVSYYDLVIPHSPDTDEEDSDCDETFIVTPSTYSCRSESTLSSDSP